VAGAKIRGSFFLDFYNGNTEPTYNYARIRTASIGLDWDTRSLLIGIEKPIFAPREPNSLMQLGISPLTASGNLWRWQPQVRFEQRVQASESLHLRAQIGVLQTSEEFGVPPAGVPGLDRRRPGLEGRFEISRRLDDNRRIEIAPGFHASTSHAAAGSAASNLFSLDWFANPWQKLEFSGAFFTGQNVAHFGALRQGFRVRPAGGLLPIHSRGGWAQFTFLATDRLSFNVYGGQHDDRNSDLTPGGIGKNLSGAANIMFRLAPNVITSFEILQNRTTYLGPGTFKNNRYDLAVAYLF
jgi:hypothetical protein